MIAAAAALTILRRVSGFARPSKNAAPEWCVLRSAARLRAGERKDSFSAARRGRSLGPGEHEVSWFEATDLSNTQLLHKAVWTGAVIACKLLIPFEPRDVRVVEGARLEIDSGSAC